MIGITAWIAIGTASQDCSVVLNTTIVLARVAGSTSNCAIGATSKLILILHTGVALARIACATIDRAVGATDILYRGVIPDINTNIVLAGETGTAWRIAVGAALAQQTGIIHANMIIIASDCAIGAAAIRIDDASIVLAKKSSAAT